MARKRKSNKVASRSTKQSRRKAPEGVVEWLEDLFGVEYKGKKAASTRKRKTSKAKTASSARRTSSSRSKRASTKKRGYYA